jgi:protein ImuB
MPLAEATTLGLPLCLIPHCPEDDRQGLERLATWAERFTPIVGLDESGLHLDVTGCADCFGGEKRLLHKIESGLRELGFYPRIVLASTLGAAWALARYASPPVLARPEQTEELLTPLPIASLRLPPATLAILMQLGIERVGQLLALPRTELPSRFGPEVLERLDQALGTTPEPFTPHRAVPDVQAGFGFPHPVERLDHLLQVLDVLIERVGRQLEERQQGVRAAECWLHFEQTPSVQVETRLFQPRPCGEHLRRLMQTQLERLELSEPILGMSLRVTVAEALRDVQERFTEPSSPPGLGTLIDSLHSRLGPQAVARAVLRPDPQPEYAYRLESVLQTSAPKSVAAKKRPPRIEPEEAGYVPSHALRPLQVLPTPVAIDVLAVVPDGPPVRFQWGETAYRIARSWGPERIETGWWRERDVARDYYRVATEDGNRFWLFRRRDDGRWYVHGCFD